MKRQSTRDDLEESNNTVTEDKLGHNVNNSSDDELDLLRSESSFLPVYSPLKEPRPQSFENGDYSTDFEQSVMWDTQSASVAENEVQDFPIMTEEEANKLINLAATILQAHIRGFLVRRKFDFKNYKQKHDAASKIQALWKGYHFRHRNYQGLNMKCELRAQRLQKYVATLCVMMQKVEEQHEKEKQKLLKAVSLLYDKFTQLFNKVEQQSIENRNKQNIFERNAAVTIQKHWRGHMVRKHHSRLNTSNAFQSLLTSHIQLKIKVEYLEELAANTKKGESKFATTQEESHPAFLPHPRLFEENEGKENGDESDVDESIGDQTKAFASSSDVSNGDEDDKVSSTIEDAQMFSNKDAEEQECAEEDIFLTSEDGDFKDKEEHMVHVMDKKDLVEEELGFHSNEVGEKTFEKDEDDYEESAEVMQDEVDKENQLGEEEHGNDIDQDVNKITDEEDGTEDENGRIVDPMMNLPDREGNVGDEDEVINTTLDNSFKTEVLTTEIVHEGMIEDQGLKGGSEELEDSGDHLNETVEEVKDCNIEHDQEEHVEGGGKEDMKKKENRTVGDTEDKTEGSITEGSMNAHEIQEGTFNLTGLHLINSPGTKHDDRLEETTKNSSGITQDIQVHVEKFTDSDLISSKEDEQEAMNMEGFQGENKPETKPSEADITHVSPRLGKRASSLLSALKDEISNVRLKSPETEQSSSAQAVSHPSSAQAASELSFSDPDNGSTDENSSSNGNGQNH